MLRGNGVSFWGGENVLKLEGVVHDIVNVLDAIEMSI